jgi:hypothetical protein
MPITTRLDPEGDSFSQDTIIRRERKRIINEAFLSIIFELYPLQEVMLKL